MVKVYGKNELKEDYLILQTVYKNLNNCESISILQTRKANGECAHISFLRVTEYKGGKNSVTTDYWSCSSKNVTILVSSKADINEYKEERHYYAKLIAKTWLDFLETKTPNEIKELKEILAEHTFVGEYCGNMDLQHIVKYERICLIFFSIVNKYSSDPCLPLEKSYGIFDKYGLDRVECKSYHGFTNMNLIVKKLRELYNEVGSSTVEKDGEGNVIYFMACNPSIKKETAIDKKERMITLCKLKTLEYAFFRKIREKAKNMVIKNFSAENQAKRFHREAQDLTYLRELPMPMEYYDGVCKKLFEVVEKTGLNEDMIGERFFEVLQVAKKMLDEN